MKDLLTGLLAIPVIILGFIMVLWPLWVALIAFSLLGWI